MRRLGDLARLDRATTPGGETELEIFTTRPDTIFGVKFMALSPDHPLALAESSVIGATTPKLNRWWFFSADARYG